MSQRDSRQCTRARGADVGQRFGSMCSWAVLGGLCDSSGRNPLRAFFQDGEKTKGTPYRAFFQATKKSTRPRASEKNLPLRIEKTEKRTVYSPNKTNKTDKTAVLLSPMPRANRLYGSAVSSVLFDIPKRKKTREAQRTQHANSHLWQSRARTTTRTSNRTGNGENSTANGKQRRKTRGGAENSLNLRRKNLLFSRKVLRRGVGEGRCHLPRACRGQISLFSSGIRRGAPRNEKKSNAPGRLFYRAQNFRDSLRPACKFFEPCSRFLRSDGRFPNRAEPSALLLRANLPGEFGGARETGSGSSGYVTC